jgi:hypothetical protein
MPLPICFRLAVGTQSRDHRGGEIDNLFLQELLVHHLEGLIRNVALHARIRLECLFSAKNRHRALFDHLVGSGRADSAATGARLERGRSLGADCET